MSRKGPSIDFNPLLEKVQCDISFLSYLGLHQYAKKQKLIGRSRPMITKDMDFVKQRRLNFRLLVACIQQIVGRTHFDHNGRVEQINYVNVGNYAQLRLYGLLDREMFALDTTADTTLTGWWPSQLSFNDAELLGSTGNTDTIEEHLSYNARATLEVGGAIFAKHMRKALRFIPDSLTHTAPHSQRDPRNRMKVKNLSLNLQLVESRPYKGSVSRTRTLDPGRNIHMDQRVGFVDVPCHIERLLHFRDVLWPWIQTLATPEAREAFTYVKANYPGVQAVQVKIREIRNSVMEVQRREQEAETELAERETAQAQLRNRLIATYGEPDPGEEVNEEPPDAPRGYHGMENDEPGAAFRRQMERNRERGEGLIIPTADLHHGTIDIDEDNQDEPYHTHIHADFEQNNITLAEGDQIDPIPLPNDGIEATIEAVRARMAQVLGQRTVPVETEGEEDGN